MSFQFSSVRAGRGVEVEWTGVVCLVVDLLRLFDEVLPAVRIVCNSGRFEMELGSRFGYQ